MKLLLTQANTRYSSRRIYTRFSRLYLKSRENIIQTGVPYARSPCPRILPRIQIHLFRLILPHRPPLGYKFTLLIFRNLTRDTINQLRKLFIPSTCILSKMRFIAIPFKSRIFRALNFTRWDERMKNCTYEIEREIIRTILVEWNNQCVLQLVNAEEY